uniref:Uncharacterized protein n=1 Tax=Trichogramma kaykai TaxID=54128 RepID=A0ABD2VVA1_9HYME
MLVTRIERSCEDGCTDVCASLTSTDEQQRKTERERERERERDAFAKKPRTRRLLSRGEGSRSKKNEVLYTGKKGERELDFCSEPSMVAKEDDDEIYAQSLE